MGVMTSLVRMWVWVLIVLLGVDQDADAASNYDICQQMFVFVARKTRICHYYMAYLEFNSSECGNIV